MCIGYYRVDECKVRQGQPDPMHFFNGNRTVQASAYLFDDRFLNFIKIKKTWRQTKKENKNYDKE